ncbi:hypothetical protein D7X94_09140 [Acutalibacter sp. 1XD8-33]|nr:hypothetical protein D7X94_09140 [Acutalibacter sp. 1XD8-33]
MWGQRPQGLNKVYFLKDKRQRAQSLNKVSTIMVYDRKTRNFLPFHYIPLLKLCQQALEKRQRRVFVSRKIPAWAAKKFFLFRFYKANFKMERL